MLLNINKKQYRKLVELLAIASSDIEVYLEHGLLEKTEHDDYQHLLQTLFKHSAKMDCEDAIEYSPESKEWEVTEPLFQYWFDLKYQVEMDIFKEHLAFFLAKKQVFLNHDTLNQLPDEDDMAKEIYKLADQYQPIIEQNGLGLLDWTTPESLQKQYPNANINEYLVAQSLSLNPVQSQIFNELINSEESDFEEFLNNNLFDEPINTPNIQNTHNNVIDFPTNQHSNVQPQTLQLKIMLQGSKPPVWRRIEVTNSLNLLQLHIIIQDLFSLFDYHLHEFLVTQQSIEEHLEEQITLDKVFNQTDHLDYIYDFGDNWEFKIELEQIKEHQPKKFKETQAVCTTGKRGDIIEDIGGVPMLNQLAQTLKQAKPLPQHLAEFFDETVLKLQLETFNKQQTNEALKQLTQAW